MEFDIQLKVNLPAMGFTTFHIKANQKGYGDVVCHVVLKEETRRIEVRM
jgi:hypothetical protein